MAQQATLSGLASLRDTTTRAVPRRRSARSIVLLLIALLLAANGVAGIVAACVGWQMTTQLLGSMRETSATVASQQARLVASVNGVAASVGDAAQATTGASQSTARARDSVIQATQTSTNLAATFDQL